jgi:hypothetical protein
MGYKVGDKFVIEIEEVVDETLFASTVEGYFLSNRTLDKLDRLDGDYINEHFGELQDEAFEEGKKAGIEQTMNWHKGNEDDSYKEGFNDAIELIDTILYIKNTTGKAIDIGTILDELRKE